MLYSISTISAVLFAITSMLVIMVSYWLDTFAAIMEISAVLSEIPAELFAILFCMPCLTFIASIYCF